MVSTLNLDEKYNRVRRNFCFYLDIQDHGLARSISRRIQDIGLQQEVFLTSRVSHVIRSGGARTGAPQPPRCARREGRRADAMLDRVRQHPQPPPTTNHKYVVLTVQKAISLLDKLYDTFFAASRRSHVTLFTKHFIKIEFLDKPCRPIYKEFDEWPAISLDPDPPKDNREKRKETPERFLAAGRRHAAAQKMTRKSRPRVKDREEKEPKGGYCEMCNAEYADAALHRRSAHHVAFVRDRGNFLALDHLIAAAGDVDGFLDKAAPLNGERRSQRRLCNGDAARAPSQSPDSALGGHTRHYYKVVGVGTKLRSGGGFARRRDSPPPEDGAEPLVVKFRKVRRSELSVLSDEAEQFMFPKRASSTSSTSEEEEEGRAPGARRRSPAPAAPPAPVPAERRRLARPLALKEESSEEDGWPEDPRRRKRRAPPVAKRPRRAPCKTLALELPVEPAPAPAAEPAPAPAPAAPAEVPAVSPLRSEAEKCMRWEDGRLKYTPAVEQLEFAFESVPRSEPWYESFTRQDQDRVLARNVPRYFALYSTSAPKLPYEIGQLPPLKPNCCPLSDLVKQREEKPGPSRSYGTRGMKKQKIRKRTAAVQALEAHPRKSPREHASTLAILGSAGLLQRRKPPDDARSTASEDTVPRAEPAGPVEPADHCDRLRRFLQEVFEDAADYDLSDEPLDGEPAVAGADLPDVSSLVSDCDRCDLLRDQMRAADERPRARRARFKKRNRTGWPTRRPKKGSRAASTESEHRTDSGGASSAEPADTTASEPEQDDTVLERADTPVERDESADEAPPDRDPPPHARDPSPDDDATDADSSDGKLLIDLKVVVDEPKPDEKEERKSRSSSSEERELRKKRRALQGLCDWLQPVVRVARVDPGAARRLRSAARARSNRLR